MLAPRKVKYEAQKREKENLEFELDEQFAKLHNELFTNYDCNRCRNCCNMYHSIKAADIKKGSLHLGITPAEFIEQYLDGKDREGNYQMKHKPCDFLQSEGICMLGK